MDDIEAKIIQNSNIIMNYFLLKLRLSKPMGEVVPGQFVMLKVPDDKIFLRRPFSIYDYNRGILSIMYKVVGRGTDSLSRSLAGQRVLVLGPLGNGFNLKGSHRPLVVAGGIGIAGVFLLTKKLKNRAQVFFGCSNKNELMLLKDMGRTDLSVSTLDGSYGFKGDVIKMFKTHIKNFRTEDVCIFACGPEGMLKNLKRAIEKDRFTCQVLIEERMACGMGLCFGCVKKTTDDKEPYKRVCREGPVFDIWQICL